MLDFLEVVERIEGEVRNARTIFSSESGFSLNARRSKMNPIKYKERFLETLTFINRVRSGEIHPAILQEVMTTSDFPILFGDVMDRTLLATYQTIEPGWQAYAKRAVVNDFRDAELIPPIYGADGPLDPVEQSDQYPEAALTEQDRIKWRVRKYGRKIAISWETLINDNLGNFSDIPTRLARAARRTEHRLVTNLFVGVNGPSASLYTSGNKNIVNQANGAATNNPALSLTSIEDAMLVLGNMVDEMGEPILRNMVTLVVPPALEMRARNILNATTIETTTARLGATPPASSTSGEDRIILTNWLRNSLKLVVDPYIPRIATSANGNTSWFLFADPNESREAIRIGFLRGHENPEIWMKSPNAMRVGGGDVGALAGDFDTDSVEYRVRHVTGATLVDPKATVASNGSGS